ncbi:TlpA disulfide reductase family protein [Kineococcus sp. NUM-3379]
MHRPARRPLLRLARALAAAVLLAGCGGDDLPPAGYAAAGEAVVERAPGERGEPLELSGTSAEGERVDLADLRGSVVVLNTWYADCPPCQKEAPVLAAAAREHADEGVRFVGVNVRNDSAEAIAAFQDGHGIDYPSIRDGDGSAQLALRGVAPNATPSTLVLDTAGRVAAVVAGEVEGSTLTALLATVLAEGAGA